MHHNDDDSKFHLDLHQMVSIAYKSNKTSGPCGGKLEYMSLAFWLVKSLSAA